MRFRDRRDAGRQLGERLRAFQGQSDVVVLALPRGGVPVAYEAARALHAPMDVFLVRKLGVPGRKELAMGAIASGGIRVLNDDVINELAISEQRIDRVARREMAELHRREQLYRPAAEPIDPAGKIVILVDDGLATGATMRAAIQAIRSRAPARIVVATPVGARDTCDALRQLADELICLEMPEPFHAVGGSYDDFAQTTDDEVRSLLASHRRERSGINATTQSSQETP